MGKENILMVKLAQSLTIYWIRFNITPLKPDRFVVPSQMAGLIEYFM
ncbi:hypothetical protein [Ignatzschineria cameli]|nr:hypothetical protein [Ignatzschineria cameli]